MPTWDDVCAFGLALPEVEVSTSYRRSALKVRGKGLCSYREDPDGMVIGVCDVVEKAALLAEFPDVYSATPHYDNYPAVIVHLEAIDPLELAELIKDAWRLTAGKRAVQAFDAQQGDHAEPAAATDHTGGLPGAR